MNAIIVGGSPVAGAEGFYRSLILAADTVVAADGGGSVCFAVGRTPDVWIGDFDSVPPGLVEEAEHDGVTVLRHPVEKDASDLDLALDAVRERWAASVTFTAAFSDRLDHTLASIGTLLRAVDLNACAREPGFTLYPLDARARSRLALREAPGTTISVFAIDPHTTVSIHGVRYPLDAARLAQFSSLGLSNVAADREQSVSVLAGRVLVVVGRECVPAL